MTMESDIRGELCSQEAREAGRVTRILFYLGNVERTIDIVEPLHQPWSIWFTETADANALRMGEHWHLWERGTAGIQVADVIQQMAKFLAEHIPTAATPKYAIVHQVPSILDFQTTRHLPESRTYKSPDETSVSHQQTIRDLRSPSSCLTLQAPNVRQWIGRVPR